MSYPAAEMSRKRSFEASSSSPQTGQAHKKRRHDYSEDDAQLAKIYEKLSDDLPAERLAATRQLKVFVRERPAHSPIGAISARLIRGLCSARKASRAGFYNALTELLWNASRTGHVGSILDRVLKQVDDETAPPKAASNAERHQHSLGKLTAFHALVTSGLLSATSVGAEQLRSFMHHTIDLATATAPLTEGCGRLWVDLAKAAAACKDYDKISIVMNVLNDAKSLKTPEGVAVWIACRPYMQKTKNVPVVWPNQDPLAAAPELLKCLVLALQDQEQPDGARAHNGYARRVPHFVWEMLLEDPEMTKKAWAIWESQEAKSSAGHSLHPPFGFWQSAFDGEPVCRML